MAEFQWWKKAGIGAVGGLALALLKLIDAKFFLSSVSSVEAQAGYLTYGCYMLLGSVAAVFLADHELPPPKVRRSAFILGLLAPSVLLAIANQSFRPGDLEKGKGLQIPPLAWLPLASAIAQEAPVVPTPRADKPALQVLPKSALQQSFGDALAAAVGRKTVDEPYAYVVGSTQDRQKAIDTASKVQQLISSASGGPNSVQPRVVQVRGQSSYYVIIGDLASKRELSQVRIDATSAAIKSIGANSAGSPITQSERRAIAEMLVNAPVLPARNLSVER